MDATRISFHNAVKRELVVGCWTAASSQLLQLWTTQFRSYCTARALQIWAM